MSNEIMIIKEINIAVNKMNASLIGISKNYYIIAEELYHLKQFEKIEKSNYKGYKNISEFAEAEFGFDVTKTYNLIAIHEKFFLNKSVGFYNNYKFGQLREMLPMTDEQLKLCNENMTVKEIISIKRNFSARAEHEGIANSELIKNNNVIEGVFPLEKEKIIEEQPEEKVTTIIVSELPKDVKKENKTITIDVQTEQNDNLEIKNNENESQEEFYKNLYYEALNKISEFEKLLKLKEKEINELKKKIDLHNDVLIYFEVQLKKINGIQGNGEVIILSNEIKDYLETKKLPKKVNFFNNVI